MSNHPCRRGARRHVIFGHNRPLAPTPEGGPSGRGRPAGPAGRAPAPWSRPGAWPWWASWRGAALWRRCASTSPTWVPVGPGALGLEVGRALPSPVHDQTGAPAGGPGRPRRACIGLDTHQGGRIGRGSARSVQGGGWVSSLMARWGCGAMALVVAAMGARGPWKSRMRPGDQVPQGDPFSASSTLLVHVRNISSDESNMCPTISGPLLDSAS